MREISDAIDQISDGREIHCIGNSMGGFLAFLMSQMISARRVLAFVPQFSICPTIVPQETRWMNYRVHIKNIIYNDLSTAFTKKCHYAILVGTGGLEVFHTKLFRKHGNIDNIEICELRDAQHNVANYLKEELLLNGCIDNFFNEGIVKDYLVDNGIALV